MTVDGGKHQSPEPFPDEFHVSGRDTGAVGEREEPLDVEQLGLSDEQTRNLSKHLTARQQTLGEWIGDVLFDMGLGRPDGIEYPPATRLSEPPEEPIGPMRFTSANCREADHDYCAGMVEQDVSELGITDCLCDCHLARLSVNGGGADR